MSDEHDEFPEEAFKIWHTLTRNLKPGNTNFMAYIDGIWRRSWIEEDLPFIQEWLENREGEDDQKR